jgi:hypothetical protein
MKKLFTILILALGLQISLQAQEKKETLLLTGDTTVPELITYHHFVEWAVDEGKMATWYVDFGTKEYAIWADNPDKEGINKTEKALFMETIAGVDWWGNFFNFRMDTSITITEDNRYLHIFHYREKLNDGWSFSLNDDGPLTDADGGTLRFDGNNSQPGRWEDIVIDLKHLMDNEIPLTKFMVIVDKDWNGPRDNPATKYYFDEIALTNDPFPRGVEFLTGTDLLSFDSEDQLAGLKINTQNELNTFEVIDNPFTESAVVSDGKVGHFYKSVEAAWWQGLNVEFPGIHLIEYGVRQYLHVFVRAEIDCSIQLHIVDNTDTHDNKMFLYPKSEIDGEWFDLVWDLSNYTAIKALTVRFDVQVDGDGNYINGTPAGNFWVDGIVLDDNPYEREGTVDVGNIVDGTPNLKAWSVDQSIKFSQPNSTHAQVFDILGRSVVSTPLAAGSDLHTITVPQNGLYILRVTNSDGLVSNVKVLVGR